MQAYCVLAGGGAKAACFPGALAAAKANDVEFLGYGGTSAGALVATLAAVGYEGEDIHKIFAELQLAELLPDSGELIESLRDRVRGAASALERKTTLGQGLGLRSEWKKAKPIIQLLSSELGLYDPSILGDRLRDLINAKLDTKFEDITFKNLKDRGCGSLRILASDIRGHRPALFDGGAAGYGDSVITAAVSSAAFPGVFQPLGIGSTLLLDGGLSSNLPAFLFAEEAREILAPTIAFDLVESADSPADYQASDLAVDLLSTTLSASDELLRYSARNVVHVPIAVPASLTTFTLALPKEAHDSAWEYGYSGAAQGISNNSAFKTARKAGTDLTQQLRAKYASKELMDPVLFGAMLSLQTVTSATKLRLSVMVPTGRQTRKVIYQLGMEEHSDADLELPLGAGCTGLAYTSGDPALADLEDAALNPDSWGMTQTEANKIPDDRKAMFAVPVRAWRSGPGREGVEAAKAPVIATFAIDTDTKLDDTGWTTSGGIDGRFLEAMMRWAEVLAKLLS